MSTQTLPRPAKLSGSVQATRLDDGRLHLNQGPIDLIVGADGPAWEVRRAHHQATRRFDGLLQALVDELAVLRRPLDAQRPVPCGPVAARMVDACHPYRDLYVTPMAAVAGAVAETVLAATVANRSLSRAYVNNGGDIAFYLGDGETFDVGVVPSLSHATAEAAARISWDGSVRGIATSGFGGRSLTRGIADSVTVLADRAADADVAATLIANAVDVDHPAIRRAPASSLDPDSDLGETPVTVDVGYLPDRAVAQALANGAALARRLCAQRRIAAAFLVLRDKTVSVPDERTPMTRIGSDHP
jgi:ApbE superfamily uncharacterized protein (UPF0280 family)